MIGRVRLRPVRLPTCLREVGLSQDGLEQRFPHPFKNPQRSVAAIGRVPHDNGRRDGVGHWDAVTVVHLVNGLPGLFPVSERHDSVVPCPPRLTSGGDIRFSGWAVCSLGLDMTTGLVGAGLKRRLCHGQILHASAQWHHGPREVQSPTWSSMEHRSVGDRHVFDALLSPILTKHARALEGLGGQRISLQFDQASWGPASRAPSSERGLQR